MEFTDLETANAEYKKLEEKNTALEASNTGLTKKNGELLSEIKPLKTLKNEVASGKYVESSEKEGLVTQIAALTNSVETLKVSVQTAQEEKEKTAAELEENRVRGEIERAFEGDAWNSGQLTTLIRDKLEVTDKGDIVTVKEKKSLEEFKKGLMEDPAWQHQFKPLGNSGSDLEGDRQIRGKTTASVNPFVTKNLTAQMKLFKTDRVQYNKLKAAAKKA